MSVVEGEGGGEVLGSQLGLSIQRHLLNTLDDVQQLVKGEGRDTGCKRVKMEDGGSVLICTFLFGFSIPRTS